MNTNSDVGSMTAHPCLAWSGVVQDGTATLCTTTAAAISSLGSIFYYVVWFSAGWGWLGRPVIKWDF